MRLARPQQDSESGQTSDSEQRAREELESTIKKHAYNNTLKDPFDTGYFQFTRYDYARTHRHLQPLRDDSYSSIHDSEPSLESLGHTKQLPPSQESESDENDMSGKRRGRPRKGKQTLMEKVAKIKATHEKDKQELQTGMKIQPNYIQKTETVPSQPIYFTKEQPLFANKKPSKAVKKQGKKDGLNGQQLPKTKRNFESESEKEEAPFSHKRQKKTILRPKTISSTEYEFQNIPEINRGPVPSQTARKERKKKQPKIKMTQQSSEGNSNVLEHLKQARIMEEKMMKEQAPRVTGSSNIASTVNSKQKLSNQTLQIQALHKIQNQKDKQKKSRANSKNQEKGSLNPESQSEKIQPGKANKQTSNVGTENKSIVPQPQALKQSRKKGRSKNYSTSVKEQQQAHHKDNERRIDLRKTTLSDLNIAKQSDPPLTTMPKQANEKSKKDMKNNISLTENLNQETQQKLVKKSKKSKIKIQKSEEEEQVQRKRHNEGLPSKDVAKTEKVVRYRKVPQTDSEDEAVDTTRQKSDRNQNKVSEERQKKNRRKKNKYQRDSSEGKEDESEEKKEKKKKHKRKHKHKSEHEGGPLVRPSGPSEGQ